MNRYAGSLRFEASGDLLVVDGTADLLIRVNPATGIQTVVSNAGNFVNTVDVIVVPAAPSVPMSSTGALALLGALFVSALLVSRVVRRTA